jgi:hypothetical protein
LSNRTLTQVKKRPGDSHFWAGLMKVKDQFFARGSFRVRNGLEVRFWKDTWIEDKPLKLKYPSLYNIARRKDATVAQVLSTTPLNMSFRRSITDNYLCAWYHLVSKVVSFNLTNDKDVFVWSLQKSGNFSVRSLYTSIIQCGVVPSKCKLWNIKVPLKIKIFLWYLWKGVTLTKDNLVKRNWQGSLKCCFCSSIETIQHLFFHCHFAKFIWNTVYIAFGIQPPSSFSDLFGAWLDGIPRKLMNQILLGAAALCWAIWLNRNDMLFNNAKSNTFMQVIFRSTY